jgi:hypothetical protein
MPATLEFDGSTNLNSNTFLHTDHTVAEPHFTIVDRKSPVTKGTTTSMAVYRLRTFRGVADPTTGAIVKSVVETNIKWPTFADVADVKTDIALHGTFASNVDFQADIMALFLPRS